MFYRKKPVVIQAVQLRRDTWSEMCEFLGPFSEGTRGCWIGEDGKESPTMTERLGLVIHTLEGDMLAVENDWIIRGVQGEYYPCKPDIFEQTYEDAVADGNTRP